MVLQCGSAGHNIRSKPSLQGTPIGRLKLGDTFHVENEVGACSAVRMSNSRAALSCLCCTPCLAVDAPCVCTCSHSDVNLYVRFLTLLHKSFHI